MKYILRRNLTYYQDIVIRALGPFNPVNGGECWLIPLRSSPAVRFNTMCPDGRNHSHVIDRVHFCKIILMLEYIAQGELGLPGHVRGERDLK